MEHATEELLRKAAIEALSAKKDRSAMELLTLIHAHRPQALEYQTALALPVAQSMPAGVPHDCDYWIRFIRETFIPFMIANGRYRFTSHELFSWIENSPQAQLTTEDLQQLVDGKTVWRDIASNALTNLKRQGVIDAPFRGKSYQITVASQHFIKRELESQQ